MYRRVLQYLPVSVSILPRLDDAVVGYRVASIGSAAEALGQLDHFLMAVVRHAPHYCLPASVVTLAQPCGKAVTDTGYRGKSAPPDNERATSQPFYSCGQHTVTSYAYLLLFALCENYKTFQVIFNEDSTFTTCCIHHILYSATINHRN